MMPIPGGGAGTPDPGVPGAGAAGAAVGADVLSDTGNDPYSVDIDNKGTDASASVSPDTGADVGADADPFASPMDSVETAFGDDNEWGTFEKLYYGFTDAPEDDNDDPFDMDGRWWGRRRRWRRFVWDSF